MLKVKFYSNLISPFLLYLVLLGYAVVLLYVFLKYLFHTLFIEAAILRDQTDLADEVSSSFTHRFE